MCHNTTNSRKINRLHDRSLHIIQNGKMLPFSELLEKNDSVSIKMRNIQSLAVEIFHVCGNLSTPSIIFSHKRTIASIIFKNFWIFKTTSEISILQKPKYFISRTRNMGQLLDICKDKDHWNAFEKCKPENSRTL